MVEMTLRCSSALDRKLATRSRSPFIPVPANFSTFTTALPVTVGASATESLTIRFDDVGWTETGAGADFANVNAIQFQINVVAAADAQFDFTQTVGPTTEDN